MLTLGIIVDGSPEVIDGVYKWKIIIPTLYGIPNSQAEQDLFQAYYDVNKKIKELQEEEDKVKNSKDVIYKFLYALKKKQTVSKLQSPSDEILQYITYASLCDTPGNTVIAFNTMDVVVVGFKDNKMSQPIIIGLCQTTSSIVKPSLVVSNVTQLFVQDEAQLSPKTKIGVSYGNSISYMSTDDIYRAVQLVKALDERDITVDKLDTLVKMIDSLQLLIGGGVLGDVADSIIPG